MAGAKHQKFELEIDPRYSAAERRAIAHDVIDWIVERVQNKNLDRRNRPLPEYSASYVKSLDFKIGGKKKGDVNLTLSGDMLGAIEVLEHQPGKIVIGFEEGSTENAKADGNIRGTYGQSKPTGPKRDFLGLTKKDLNVILAEFPVKDKRQGDIQRAAEKVARGRPANVDPDDEGDDG